MSDDDSLHDFQTNVTLGRPLLVSEADELIVGVPLDPKPTRVWRVVFFRGPGGRWPTRLGRNPPTIIGGEVELRTQDENLEEALGWLRQAVDATNRVIAEEEIPREIEFRRLHDEAIAHQERERAAEAEAVATRREEREDRLRKWHDSPS